MSTLEVIYAPIHRALNRASEQKVQMVLLAVVLLASCCDMKHTYFRRSCYFSKVIKYHENEAKDLTLRSLRDSGSLHNIVFRFRTSCRVRSVHIEMEPNSKIF